MDDYKECLECANCADSQDHCALYCMCKLEEENEMLRSVNKELYDCLREAVIEMCHNFECCGPYPEYTCNGSKDCFVKRWRSALARAAGEEVAE